MGLLDTVSIPTLLKMVASGRIPAEKMGIHSFTFAQMDGPTTGSRTPPRTPPSRW
jgi:hypothetical protein